MKGYILTIRRMVLGFFALLVFALMVAPSGFAQAAIIVEGTPIDGFFEPSLSVGGGAVIPLVRFRLNQSSGTDTLSKVGVIFSSAPTLSSGSISRVSLWRESGATPGFQLSEDTFLPGAAGTTVVGNTLITLTPSTAVSVGSAPSEFYIVASTTAASGITQGNRFNVTLQDNFASTTAGSGLGSAFTSAKYVVLNQGSPIKISEVRAGVAGNAGDEFIELYNSSDTAIDLRHLPLHLHIVNAAGTAGEKTLTYYKSVIPAHGYFLITSQTNYSGSVPPDAVYTTLSGNTLVENGAVSLATTSTAIADKFDLLGWGTQNANNCENGGTAATACATALVEDGSTLERVAVGDPAGTSTAAQMAAGGADASKGNGVDRNDNSAEFVLQGSGNPQNSRSQIEFSFGGGVADSSALRVNGSFPGDGMTSMPTDLSSIGFDFNKPINPSTLTTSSVTFKKVESGVASGSSLCAAVLYNPAPGSFEPPARCVISAALLANTSYVFEVTSAVQDLSSNALDQDSFTAGQQTYLATSTTGGAGQTFTNVTPPSVVGINPFNGGLNIPTNLATLSVEFNQTDMKISTLVAQNITISSGTLSDFSFSTTTGKGILTATVAGLAANTAYTVTVGTGVQNNNNIGLPVAYTGRFTTGGSADVTAPQVRGILPTPNSTIAANTNDFIFTFDDPINLATATSGAITLGIQGGANLPVSVTYDPVAKEGHVLTSNVLPVGQTLQLTILGASLKNTAGIALGANKTYVWTVEGANSDTVVPSILFATADDFGLAITFSEAVNANDALLLANYALTVGGVSQTLTSLAGHSITYDASRRTAEIEGIRMASGAAFTITASNIKDLSGNLMTSSAFTGSVESFTDSGGFGGPGAFTGSTFGEIKDFSGAGIGFIPPVGIMPQSNFANASTTYSFDLPISTRIPADGSIVITFPSSSDYGICCTATTSTSNPFLAKSNNDINGPGPGTVGIKTITANAGAKTVTLTFDTATRLESGDSHDFLRFSLAGIKNPSIAKGFDTSGYTLDIKSKDASGTLLESFSGNPVFINGGAGGGATTTISGTVSGNGGNLAGVTIRLMSPQTGPLEATSNGSGAYIFADIPVNTQFLSNNFGGGQEFFIATDAFVEPTGTTTTFFGQPAPVPLSVNSTTDITHNFTLTPTTGALNFIVKLTAAANTFEAGEQVDVFAAGPGSFVVNTVTPGAGALSAGTIATIPIPAENGRWGIGMGPAMPKGGGAGFSGPPPSTAWSMPAPIEVLVSGCPSSCSASVNNSTVSSHTFSISTADKTIAGILKDASGNAISSAMVYAFSPTNGTGSHTQTSASGVFSIAVVEGAYNVGSFSPGIGQSKEVPVNVDSSGNAYVNGNLTASTGATGANPFVLKISKPSYTIKGRVTDGTNPVGNAPVFAYRTDAPGHVDATTDSSTGNYTLYVDSGTWKVASFIPGFGPMGEQTVIISGASQSDIDFAPSSSQSYSILSGNLYEDTNANDFFDAGEGVSGAVIRLSGTSGSNEGKSGSDGAYSMRVPSGAGYQITDVFKPGYGKIAALGDTGTAIGAINLTASTTQNIRITSRSTVSISIEDPDGNKILVPRAFIDLFDTATGITNHVEVSNASSTQIQLAQGTTPQVRTFIQGVPTSQISIATGGAGTAVSGNIVTVDGATESIKIVVGGSSSQLSTISGTAYHTSQQAGNELSDAWIQFVDETNGVHFGTQANASGAYSVQAADGTYQVVVARPGYVGAPVTLTVSGNTSKSFVLSSANISVSGTITAGGSAAADAFVRAEKVGGGQAVTRADASGSYTLYLTSGTWRIFAVYDGYGEKAYASNPVAVSGSVSNVDIALTTTVSVSSKLATSNTFTDTSSGSLSDSTLGIKVDIGANALGSAGSNAYLNAKETTNFPNTTSVNIVGSKAKEINAYSGGSKVTNLAAGSTASLDLSYTVADLSAAGITSTSTTGKLNVVTYSEDKQEWETLSTVATYKDSAGATVASPSADLSNVASVTFTAITSHFSTFALSSPTGVEPPATPAGLAASAGSVGSAQVTISWNAVSGATGYYLYRNTPTVTSYPLLADVGNVTTYTDTGLTPSGAYSYKVSAYKSGGESESAASAAVDVTAPAVVGSGGVSGGGGGGGGGGTSSAAPPVAFTSSTAIAGGGGTTKHIGSSGSSVTVLIASDAIDKNVTVTVKEAGSANVNTPSGTKIVGTVYALSALYADAGDTRTPSFASPVRLQFAYTDAMIPAGVAEPSLALFTRASASAAWEKLIGSSVDPVANVVTATTTHFSEFAIFGETGASVIVPSTPTVSSAGSAVVGVTAPAVVVTPPAVTSSAFTRSLSLGDDGDDVAALQTFLENGGYLVIPPGIAKGYFGALTKTALAKYQVASGIEPIGIFGPQTQASVAGVAVVAGTSVIVTPAAASSAFTRSLSLGDDGDDVVALQTFLENGGYLVIPPGIAKGYFGALTKTALAKYQAASGIEPIGIFGPQTRAAVAGSAAKGVATPAAVVTPAVTTSSAFTRSLFAGTVGEDVRALQRALNADTDTVIALTGDGSPGNETTYFGILTERAVQKFQEKYKIAQPGAQGYGIFGPVTRAALEKTR